MPLTFLPGAHTTYLEHESGVRGVLEQALVRARLPLRLDWKFSIASGAKGTPHSPRLRVHGVDQFQTLRLTVKYGGNDTAVKVSLIVPGGYAPHEVERRLREIEDDIN